LNKVKFFFYLVILLVSPLLWAQQSDSLRKTERIQFDPERVPEHDLQQAIALVKDSNKRIILDVGGEWCIWCHRLDKFFEDNSDIKKFMEENFFIVKVNFSPENENEKFLSRYPKVPGYPHLFILDNDGKFLHSQDTGKLEAGKGYDKESVIAFLNKWAITKVQNPKIN